MAHVIDQLMDLIDEKKTPLVVGLDPDVNSIPQKLFRGYDLENQADAYMRFCCGLIDATSDLAPAVKPQIGCFEVLGPEGARAFKDVVDYAKEKGLIVIEDGKRGDIKRTSGYYATGHLGSVETDYGTFEAPFNVDILTVNTAYLGNIDSLTPFADVCKARGKGVFVLVKTSNPNSGQIQDRIVELARDECYKLGERGIELEENKTQLYKLVALQVDEFARQHIGNRGYSSIGAVVGATYPKDAEILRKIMPYSYNLAPGLGKHQGGKVENITNLFNSDGYGAVIPVSSEINYEFMEHGAPEMYKEHARAKTISLIKEINSALSGANKLPEGWKI